MKNYKTKVNSKDESKEAQELFESLGYEKGACSLGSYPAVIVTIQDWATGGYCSTRALGLDVPAHENYKEITLPELRDMAHQEQDEPFLTPETTLNDQYAEIEQVRQEEIHGAVKANPDFNSGSAQPKGGVDATLAQRQSTYGNFEDVAFVTENIMSILGRVRVNGLSELPNTHRMALYMIASKMARIVNGDCSFIENWHDISGYAKLIENELMQTSGSTNSRIVYQVVKNGVLEDKNES